ncbi:hypothetical protein WEN_03055 [Mycoplasma wenyonii str. Massachusetts]|uniref:Uncharacterized protein n=1 Tax=Mycoplasma wenyonii (strain Massachusetts) TaxID=1197325 RepID=I6ZFK0_MYCWM|nr:hypothetical protein [Mycoplasma wenyonii]AFN65392.1 hypothetical protein WEN_03055 [Mycoplasma wenyonii str. Massachusetts]
MASTILFKFLGGLLTVGAVSAIPTAIIYSSSNNSSREINIDSFKTQKSNCWVILSDTVNQKDLSVCQIGESLKYYVVNKSGEDIKSIKEIEKVLSSTGEGTLLGGSVIVKPKGEGTNESFSGVKGKDETIKTLGGFSQGGLYSKCRSIDSQDSDAPKLNCGSEKSIPLTKY